jgi:hypothetical protein
MPIDLQEWLRIHASRGRYWYLKRLSGNDTLANGTHQAGPYLPKQFLFSLFPALNRPEVLNPDTWFDLLIDSHDDHRRLRAIWYNNKLHSGTRNETRITGLGGHTSALLNPENTGALVLFAFSQATADSEATCHLWVCRNLSDENLIEDRFGPIEPGTSTVLIPHSDTVSDFAPGRPLKKCWLEPSEIPSGWLEEYPSGAEFARKSLELQRYDSLPPDKRLVRRRECEYELYRSVEEAAELPKIRQGFDTMDSFLSLAQSILQRRKARSGTSLEIHARAIFKEEGLLENQQFAYQIVTPRGRRPDFVFPSEAAYLNPMFPAEQLRMLAVKTSCKDRWRQVLNEADRRIPRTHLLTVQEGVSEAQHKEMAESGVKLVVPAPLKTKFPRRIRTELQTLGEFIDEVRQLIREV